MGLVAYFLAPPPFLDFFDCFFVESILDVDDPKQVLGSGCITLGTVWLSLLVLCVCCPLGNIPSLDYTSNLQPQKAERHVTAAALSSE